MSALQNLLLRLLALSSSSFLPPNRSELPILSNLTYTRLFCSFSNYAPIPHSSNAFHLDQTARRLSLSWSDRRRRTCFTRSSISVTSTIPHTPRP